MKGLILKDIYQLRSYAKVFFLVVLFCVLMGSASEDINFMTYYPSVVMNMLPISMYTYDENFRFHIMLAGLPVKKSTYVSAKYVLGILLALTACIITGTVQGVKMAGAGTFVPLDFLIVMTPALATGLIAPALTLPFIFLFGAEKGRLVNLITVIIFMSSIKIFVDLENNFQVTVGAGEIVTGIIIISVILYGLSWFITSKIFEKKEY